MRDFISMKKDYNNRIVATEGTNTGIKKNQLPAP